MTTELEARVAGLEARVATLEQAIRHLAEGWIPWVKGAIQGLQALAANPAPAPASAPAPAEAAGPRQPIRRPYRRNWRDYLIARIMGKQGKSIRQVSLSLGIPYSTCHNYFYFRDDEVARLKEYWEAEHGPLDEAALMAEIAAKG
jgi:hypothetical protein